MRPRWGETPQAPCRTRLRSLLPFGVALLVGCAAEVPPPPITGVAIPVRDTVPKGPPPREEPPGPGSAKPSRFPRVTWADLPGGLKLATIPTKGLPIVHARVVVGVGHAADGERPGLAAVTAELLREGGGGSLSGPDLAARLAALGTELSIETGFDATTISLSVTRGRLGEALDLLAALVRRPQLPAAELARIQKREAERLALAARADAAWGALGVLHHDLFSLPTEHHPYATWSPTSDEVRKLTVADCRAFHRRFYVPRNVAVVVAGDAAPDVALALAGKAFAGSSGGEAEALSFTDPVPPESRKITLVDRPGATEGDVFVGALGPARADRSFAAFALAVQVLGGPAGRLSTDLVGKRGLALAGDAGVTELAHGPTAVVAHVRARASGTGPALQALLEAVSALGRKAPDTEEVEGAARALAGGLARSRDGAAALAREVGRLRTLGLPDDHEDAFRKELSEMTPALVLKAAGDHLREGHEIVVVSGDAAALGPALARFGEVKVVDPTRGFARVRTLPMDRSAPPAPPKEARR